MQTPKERRHAILEEYDRSRMTGRAFAPHYGLKYKTFAEWVAKRRKRGHTFQVKRVNLVEAVMEGGLERPLPISAGVRVELPGGASVEMADKRQAELVAILIQNQASLAC